MKRSDITAMVKSIMPAVQDYLIEAVSPLVKRVADLEGRKPEKGDPGQSVTLADVAPLIKESVKVEIAALPPAQPGRDGEDGKSITASDVAPLIAEEVAKAVSAIPVPTNGDHGKDGAGLASGLIDRAGNLILTLTNGETKDLGRVVGENGKAADPVKPETVTEIVREEVKKAVAHIEALGPSIDPATLPALVDKTVAEHVAKIPAPKNGENGKDADPAAVAALVSAEVEKAVAAIPPARDGIDVDPETVAEMVAAEVAKAAAGIPVPKDGKDADPVEVDAKIAEAVEKAVAAIPTPKDGRDVDQSEVDRKIAEGIDKAIALLPRPADGKDADPEMIERMVSERVERAIATLPKPKDGLDAVQFLRNEAGHLVCTMSDGSVKDLGVINGADGFGFDDLQAEYDGERRLVIRFAQGERVKEFEAVLPVIIDRGVYSPGKSYERGDAISFGGALWICQAEKSDEKPGTNADWRLAVKKGRDARPHGSRQ